jgi:predicted  nucleic acid-binding Zn-ribbon protein
MPHQCVRCSTMYDDGAEEILKGCSCGARLFFFIRKKHLKQAENMTVNLSEEEKEQIEKDVFDLVDVKPEDDKPVILEFESINVMKPGKYEINLVHLFKKDPVIFKVGEGKYVIDIQETFRQMQRGELK